MEKVPLKSTRCYEIHHLFNELVPLLLAIVTTTRLTDTFQFPVLELKQEFLWSSQKSCLQHPVIYLVLHYASYVEVPGKLTIYCILDPLLFHPVSVETGAQHLKERDFNLLDTTQLMANIDELFLAQSRVFAILQPL